ncbi:hypothetical protein ACIQU6_07530 [Streptomyces sp. NPDC090442]|uniref:hypothetical protein n=1 Tax=Streptomyces sp. NPDC090442 TaxID=3365962 RepID=UPI00382F7C98
MVIYQHGIDDGNWGINTGLNRAALPKQPEMDFDYTNEYHPAAKTAYDLADNVKGFFAWMQPEVTNAGAPGGDLKHTMFFAKREPASKHVAKLIDGENCSVGELFIDGASWARVAYAYGQAAEHGSPDPLVTMHNPTSKRHQWPVRDVFRKYTSIQFKETLTQKAETMLRFGQRAITIPRVTLYSHLPIKTTSGELDLATVTANKGDTVHLEVPRSRFGEQMVTAYMITETQTTVGDDGSCSVDLGLIERDMFRATESD